MLMIKEHSGIQISNWIIKNVYFMFIALENFSMLDVPASNRVIIEQGVSEWLNFTTVVEHTIPFTSF